jgi:transcriptional regulator with XRE-family HTH domain
MTANELAVRTGKRIRAHRLDQGLTYEALAATANVSMRTLCRVEDGEDCRLSTLHAVAQALGLTFTHLFAN